MRLRKKALCLIALLSGFSATALAHDVRASWTSVRFSPGACELTVRLHAEAVRRHERE
jgi:hypothetical protein